MRSWRWVAGALVLADIASATPAAAQGQGFALDRFDPAERGSEWFVLDSLDLRGAPRLTGAGVVGAWASKPLVGYNANGQEQAALIKNEVTLHPGASLALWDRVRAAASMPVVVYQAGKPLDVSGTTYRPPSEAPGDLRLSADVRLFGTHLDPITGAVGAAVYLPTGSREDYTSDGNVRFTPRAAIAGDIAVITYALRAGFGYRALDERYQGTKLGSELNGAAAAGLRVADGKLVIGPELFGSTNVATGTFFRRTNTPVEWLMGAHCTLSELRLGAGAGSGLTRGLGTPALRAFLSAEWVPGYADDRDHDGVVDSEDACPQIAGVHTSDPKTNGCPKPAPPVAPRDRDNDGIVDNQDACPDVPGVNHDDAGKNGCPADRDGDGVPDLIDVCPDTRGPKSNDPGKNGCPPDRDGDGIADTKDACPDLKGDANADPTANGCPPDADGDGVYDKEDACPAAPGPGDPDPKRNGCPLARLEDGEIRILDQVRFKNDSAEISRDSDATLVSVAMVLKDNPAIAKVRIEGHTDSSGTAAHNRALSLKRAQAVEKWLTTYGLEKGRFESKGLGSADPIDSNDTETGRQNNRRVEFHVFSNGKPVTGIKQ